MYCGACHIEHLGDGHDGTSFERVFCCSHKQHGDCHQSTDYICQIHFGWVPMGCLWHSQIPSSSTPNYDPLFLSPLFIYIYNNSCCNFLEQNDKIKLSMYKKIHKKYPFMPVCVGKNIGQQYCWCSLMWLMPLRSLSNCDYELKNLPRLILGPIHSNQVMGTDPVGSYHGTRNSRSNSINPTYPYQSHD